MRQFIRHPCSIPIEISPSEQPSDHFLLSNISQGGLACHSPKAFAEGSFIQILIPLAGLEENFEGKVVWCNEAQQQFHMGIQFLGEEEGFRLRMVEQLCHIEEYRESQKRFGRDLDSEQAASEWIEKYAHQFPS